MYGAGAAWSRLILPGAGADPSRSEPESAPGPWPSGAGARAGAGQKSGGSATLVSIHTVFIEYANDIFVNSFQRNQNSEQLKSFDMKI